MGENTKYCGANDYALLESITLKRMQEYKKYITIYYDTKAQPMQQGMCAENKCLLDCMKYLFTCMVHLLQKLLFCALGMQLISALSRMGILLTLFGKMERLITSALLSADINQGCCDNADFLPNLLM